MNTRTARNTWHDIFQLIRPLAVDWLRNTWGNVNEFGRPVYDVLQRDRHVLHTTSFTYDRLGNFTEDESAESRMEARNIILPSLRLFFIYCASLPNIIQ
jgi:hypothetical protein